MLELSVRFGRSPVRLVPVIVGDGALGRLVGECVRRRAGFVVVVSDATVASLHGIRLLGALRAAGLRAELLSFPPGERSKTRTTKAVLEDRLAGLGAGRELVLVALGGGVTGDLAGFLAATWHRGVPVFHAPSTLLAMADSALGGKTGVDIPGGKNLVGAFHQPAGVFADLSLLRTLPDLEWQHGYAEIVKTAIVSDRRFFEWLEGMVAGLTKRRPSAVEHAVAECVRLKGRIVSRDEREAGRRAVLNFGHTAAHAIEAASRYRIPHGRAVAIGLRAEGMLAVQAGRFPFRHQERLVSLLRALSGGELTARVARPSFLKAVLRDKKNRGGEVRCALPVGIGRMIPGADPTAPVDPAVLFDAVVWDR